MPTGFRFFKVNTNIAFSEDRIGIGILVRNHRGIPLFAKALQCTCSFFVDYSELLGVIEGYVVSSSLSAQLIIESDSLLAVSCLSHDGDDLS